MTALSDKSDIVRIEAAGALARHGKTDVALAALTELFQDKDHTVVLYAARTVELLGNKGRAAHDDMKTLFERFEEDPGDLAWFIRFATSGYLNRVNPLNDSDLSGTRKPELKR